MPPRCASWRRSTAARITALTWNVSPTKGRTPSALLARYSVALRPPNDAFADDQSIARPIGRREQKAGNEGEMIHKESEFRLVAVPVRGAMKGKSQEQHIGGGKQRRLGEEGAGP